MESKVKRSSPSGESGYPLVRLQLVAKPAGTDVIAVAYGFYVEPEFLVLRESRVPVSTAPEFEHPDARDARELRDSMIEDGTLVRHGVFYIFQRDYVFHSLSLAASVILGQPASGLDRWQNISGIKLADLLAEPVPA